MMPSSPPTHAGDKQHQPASPTHSQYSIDLNALEVDSHSGTSTPLPIKHVDKVLSEDIDGPSDFTQNMEAWMRGGTLQKKSHTTTMKGSLRGLEKRSDEDLQHFDAHEGDSDTPSPTRGADFVGQEHSGSRHTPSNSPPKESVFSDRAVDDDDQGEEEVSSDWDPYAEAATPHPPIHHQQLLQPTVEEYYSEITPARIPSFSAPQSPSQDSHDEEPDKPSSAHQPNNDMSTPGRPSSPTLSPVHSPIFLRSVPAEASLRQFSSQTAEATFDHQLRELREKCERLERLNATLSQSLEQERMLRKREGAMHETQLAEAARQEKDLSEMKDHAYTHKEDFRREFAELKESARRFEAERSAHDREIEKTQRDHVTDVQKLTEQMERERANHGPQIRALEHDIELASRSRDNAEESAKLLREEIEEYRDGNDAELDCMRLDLDEVDDLRDRVAELEKEVKGLREENVRIDSAKSTAEGTTDNLRAELAILEQNRNEETTKITADHRRAVDMARDLQSKLEDLRQQLKDQQATHESNLERLRGQQLAAQPGPDEGEVESLRKELESKQADLNTVIFERDAMQDCLTSTQSDLNAAILDRDEAQDSLHTVRTDLISLKAEVDDRNAVDEALDKRVSDAIRKRELYWRSRLAEGDEERRLMAKALLRLWGRDEVGGVEEPQGYLYKYLRREDGEEVG